MRAKVQRGGFVSFRCCRGTLWYQLPRGRNGTQPVQPATFLWAHKARHYVASVWNPQEEPSNHPFRQSKGASAHGTPKPLIHSAMEGQWEHMMWQRKKKKKTFFIEQTFGVYQITFRNHVHVESLNPLTQEALDKATGQVYCLQPVFETVESQLTITRHHWPPTQTTDEQYGTGTKRLHDRECLQQVDFLDVPPDWEWPVLIWVTCHVLHDRVKARVGGGGGNGLAAFSQSTWRVVNQANLLY